MKTVSFSLRAPEEYAERRIKEKSHAFRSKFMRDRDRIMYCKAFRRLALKTQIFVNGFDDHTRNRLTHTLEVSQIARTISRVLKLDQDLTEAIALGHDLGHTPFGHVGERTLNLIMNACDPTVRDYFEMGDFGNIFLYDEDKGFKHNLQSVRVAVDLESPILNHESGGLNLTNFTLFGIQIHSKLKWSDCKYESNENCYLYPKSYPCTNENTFSVGYYKKYEPYLLNSITNIESWSFEAYVVAWADEIAQRHHDIEDALEGKFITEQGVINLIEKYFAKLLSGKRKTDFIQLKKVIGKPQFLPRLSRFLVDYLVTSLIDISIKNLKIFCEKNSIKTNKDFVKIYPTLAIAEIKDIIGFKDYSSNNTSFDEAHDKFQDDLKSIVLNSFSVHRMDGKAKFIIRRLFKAYLTNPQQLPDKTIYALFREYGHIPDYNEIEIGQLRNQLEIFKNPAKNSTLSEPIQSMVDFRVALLRIISDYIGGMTDSYAQKEYDKLY